MPHFAPNPGTKTCNFPFCDSTGFPLSLGSLFIWELGSVCMVCFDWHLTLQHNVILLIPILKLRVNKEISCERRFIGEEKGVTHPADSENHSSSVKRKRMWSFSIVFSKVTFHNSQSSTYLWHYLFEASAPLKKKADTKVQELHDFTLRENNIMVNID